MKKELFAIERRDGVTIYGKRIDKFGRLGQFEVGSDRLGNPGFVYTKYEEAKNRMNALIGVHEKGSNEDTKRNMRT